MKNKNLDNHAKEIKIDIETLNLTSFKDLDGFDWLAISDTPKSFWKWNEKQCITITKSEASILAKKLTEFASL